MSLKMEAWLRGSWPNSMAGVIIQKLICLTPLTLWYGAIAASALLILDAEKIFLSQSLTSHAPHQVIAIMNNLQTQHMMTQRCSGYEVILCATQNLTINPVTAPNSPTVLQINSLMLGSNIIVSVTSLRPHLFAQTILTIPVRVRFTCMLMDFVQNPMIS